MRHMTQRVAQATSVTGKGCIVSASTTDTVSLNFILARRKSPSIAGVDLEKAGAQIPTGRHELNQVESKSHKVNSRASSFRGALCGDTPRRLAMSRKTVVRVQT